MLNVYAYPADEYGCGHYRIIWPCEAVQALEPDVKMTIIPPGDESGLIALQDPATRKVVDVMGPADADVIILQRPMLRYLAEAVPILRAKGVTVIVDIDDDLTCVHPDNPAWRMMHPKNTSLHSWQHVTEACRHATMTTVSSEALTHRYGTCTRFLPNCVPEYYLDIEHVDSAVTGWAGSLHSHPDDLDVMGLAVKKLTEEGEQFLIVGNGLGAGRHLGLGHVDPDYTGAVPVHEWAYAVSKLGVGVAPLSDTKFNAAKSWLKPLEYSAVGVPWVASPRAEYARLHRHGAGLLADRPRDWLRALRMLVKDEQMRNDLASQGRQVASAWTYEKNVHRWVEAWVDARRMDVRRRISGTTSSRS
jgi:glycosyltransferase involved in cell wall biosynthesis